MEYIERFLNWLNYEDLEKEGAKSASKKKNRRRALLLTAPEPPRQITQRSMHSPQRLCEIAADYEAAQARISNEQYEAFLNTGYPNFMQWVECLVETSATFGGRVLLLAFDHSTGIVTGATPGTRQILPPTSYALPISQSTVRRLALEAADRFVEADFKVHMRRQEASYSSVGALLTPPYDCVEIRWAEAEL